jgi:hypothetical protein
MLSTVTVVQQVMTELKRAMIEEAKRSLQNLSYLSWDKLANRIHRAFKIIAFNANRIWRQRHEFNKQLQDLHIDVALFSETHLKPHKRLHTPNYNLYRIDRQPRRKGSTAVAVRKGISHTQADLSPLVSIEATVSGLHPTATTCSCL